MAEGTPVALRHRRTDLIFIAFFVLNFGFVTYFFDAEQVTVANGATMTTYPAWPPAPVVDLVHWYGRHYDPLLMARPPFWHATIWIDLVVFGPFYAAAIYAFIRGRGWIRVPSLVWAGMMLSNVVIILFEEKAGQFATPHFPMVVSANLAWIVFPLAMIWRMRRDGPFTSRAPSTPLGSTEPTVRSEPAVPSSPVEPSEPVEPTA